MGRFHKQDRFAEKYLDFSPYQYAGNNPIKNIDVNGDSIWVSITTPSINSDGYTTTQTTDYYYGEDGDGNSGFIGPDGKIYSGNNSFVNKTAAAIDYLRQGKDGKSLVDDLITSGNSTEIIATNGSNKAEKNNGDYIKFNPNGFKGGVDQYGSTTRLPAFGLAHEMAHVQDIWNGTVSNGPWQNVTLPNGTIRTIENNEINATHVENKIRAENGRPLRAIYGDRLIISPATNNSIYYNQNGTTNYSPIESTQSPYIYK